VTWNQLGIHERGCVVLNINGYWDGLMQWVRGSVEAGFVRERNGEIMIEAKTGEEAVEALSAYKVNQGQFKLKWGNQ